MSQNKGGLRKTEEAYLQIFKITILVALSVALIGALLMLLVAANDYWASPNQPSPAQSAQPPKMEMQSFINGFVVSETPQATPTTAVPAEKPKKQKAAHVVAPAPGLNPWTEKIWGYADQYQKKSGIGLQLTKEVFVKKMREVGFPPSNVGEDFLNSEDAFIKELLETPAVIELGESQPVVTKIIDAALLWHAKEWHRQVMAGKRFEAQEALRVSVFEAKEELRVGAKKAQMAFMLHGALWAFGAFLSLALLLIFAKIETDLRDIREELGSNKSR